MEFGTISFLWLFLLSSSDSIFVRVYESRMDLMRAVIIGAEGTPYHDGLFFFDLYLPGGFPNVPPVCGWRYSIELTIRCCNSYFKSYSFYFKSDRRYIFHGRKSTFTINMLLLSRIQFLELTALYALVYLTLGMAKRMSVGVHMFQQFYRF